MDGVIVYKGKEYTKEDVEKIKEIFIKVANAVKSAIEKMLDYMKKVATAYVKYLRKNAVGYKRYFKREQLLAYERESAGKSNNWRKIHGLHLRRRL